MVIDVRRHRRTIKECTFIFLIYRSLLKNPYIAVKRTNYIKIQPETFGISSHLPPPPFVAHQSTIYFLILTIFNPELHGSSQDPSGAGCVITYQRMGMFPLHKDHVVHIETNHLHVCGWSKRDYRSNPYP